MIKDKNFTLRHPILKDLSSYYDNKNDKLIAKNMVFFNQPYKLNDAKKELIEIIKNNNKRIITEETFIIDINKKAVGEIQICNIIPKFKAKLSYWIGKNYRGKGIATKTVKLITKYGFRKYKLKRIIANVRTFNKASVGVLEKAGYKLEGTLRKNVLKNGKYYDDFIYAMVK